MAIVLPALTLTATKAAAAVPFWDTEEGYAGPLFATNPWQLVIVAGQKLPGIATRVKGRASRRIDNKEKAGSDGATPTLHGYKSDGIEIELQIWTPAQWSRFQQVLPAFWTRSTKTPNKPVAIYYPGLALLGIGQMIVSEVESPDVPTVETGLKVSIKGWEFLKDKGKKNRTDTPVPVLAVYQNDQKVGQYVEKPISQLKRPANAAQPKPSLGSKGKGGYLSPSYGG